jgi:hypothetical protein
MVAAIPPRLAQRDDFGVSAGIVQNDVAVPTPPQYVLSIGYQS